MHTTISTSQFSLKEDVSFTVHAAAAYRSDLSSLSASTSHVLAGEMPFKGMRHVGDFADEYPIVRPLPNAHELLSACSYEGRAGGYN